MFFIDYRKAKGKIFELKIIKKGVEQKQNLKNIRALINTKLVRHSLSFTILYSYIIYMKKNPFISGNDSSYFVVCIRKRKTYRKCW